MQFSTDFREYRRGLLPGDFTERWTTGGYSCVEGSYIDPSHKSYLQINGSVANNSLSTRTAISWNAPEVSTYSDQEILCLLRPINSSNGVFTSIALRGGGTATSPNVYRITIMDNGTYTVNKFIAAVNTTFYTGTKTFVIGGLYWFRFRVNSTTISAKVWNDGEDEPASWTYSGTDSTLTSGWMGFSLGGTNVSRTECIYLSVGTAGDTALYPFELASSGSSGGGYLLIEDGGDHLEIESGDSQLLEDVAQGLQSITLDFPMAEWVNDPETEYAVTAKIDYYDPVTRTFGTHWISSHYMNTGPADYPANTSMPGYIRMVECGESVMAGGQTFGTPGKDITATNRLEITSPVIDVDSVGLLDSWLAYNYLGQVVEIRVGRLYIVPPTVDNPNGVLNPHRNYEVVLCGKVEQNPRRTGGNLNEAGLSLQFQTNPGYVLRHTGRRHIEEISGPIARGISTGVEVLTTTGYLTIPNHAAYNVSDFTIYMRAYLPAAGIAGATHAILARRESTTVPTDRQFYIGFYQSSHATLANKLFAQTYTGGVAVVNSITPLTYNAGRYIDIIFGYKPNDTWYFYVDGRLVERGTNAATPVLPAAPIEVGRNAPGLIWCDFRIDRYVSESQILGRFSAIREPDIYTLSMHRGDDNTGSAVTDYSATANHGTLNGVNNTDRAWVPTYLGTAEIAGQNYPFAGGVVRHANTMSIDPVRGIFRFNDRARTTGTDLTILVRGLPVTGSGVNYTEITSQGGAGTVDMVGAYDEPVTFRLTPSAGAENQTIHAGRLCHDELLNRRVLDSSSIDRDSFIAHRQQLPFRAGFYYPSSGVPVPHLMKRLIGDTGGHLQLDYHGRTAAGVYLPPINPGPYGQDTLLEFIGLPNRGVSFAPHTDHNLLQDPSKRFSLVAIVKFHRVPYYDRSVSSSFTYFPSGMTIIDKCGNSATGYYLGVDGRDGSIIFGAPGVTSASTGFHYISYKYPFQPDKWYAICGTQTSTTGRAIRIVDIANPDPQAEVSETTTGALADSPNEPLKIGHGIRGSFCGSITYAIGSSLRRTGTQHLAMADGRPTILSGSPSGIHDRFFVELREGYGDYVTDSVTGLSAYIDGVRWCPRLVLDYTRQVTHELIGDLSTQDPYRYIHADYRLNYAPMSDANISSSVTGTARLELKSAFRIMPWENISVIEDGLSNLETGGQTPLDSDTDAEYLVSLAVTRTNSNPASNSQSLMVTGTWHNALSMCVPGDELYIKAYSHGLSEGRPMRLTQVKGTVRQDDPTQYVAW